MSSNMTVGQWAGAIVGAVAGFFTGGSTWYYTAAMMASGASMGASIGGMLDPPKGPHLFGPRLSDLTQQSSSYGQIIPRVYGSVALLGNVFWIENNALKETSHTEEQGGKGGGSSSETTTYTYSSTFALGLCAGPIVGIRRIWASGTLIYDAGSSDISTMIASNASVSGWRLYLGNDTQQPDPRMQAALGIANTPAFRGLAYIVFDDFDLGKYGNTLMGAQIKVEVLTASSDVAATLVQSKVLSGSANLYKSTALYCAPNAVMDIYNSNDPLYSAGSGLIKNYSAAGNMEVALRPYSEPTGNIYVQGWSDVSECCFMDVSGNIWSIVDQNGAEFIAQSPLSATVGGQGFNYHHRGNEKLLCIEVGSVTHVTDISQGYETILFSTTTADADGRLNDIFLGENVNYSITSYPKLICYDKSWVKLWAVDLTGQLSISHGIGGSDGLIREKSDQVAVLRVDNKFWQVDSTGYKVLGAAAGFTEGYESHGGDHLIWPMWIHYAAGTKTVFTIRLDGLNNATVTLSSIVQSECLRSGLLQSGDIDSTSLVDAVRGYRVTSVSAIRSAIEPLQGAWPFDVIQAGYKIKFVRRGSSSSVASIDSDSLGAHVGGEKSVMRLTRMREMDTQLPFRVNVTHLDNDREYDPGEQYAERLNTASVNVQAVEMPIVMTADEAAQRAEILLYMYWLERNTVQFTLPATFGHLEPADIVVVNDGVNDYSLRIKDITYRADGVLEISAVYNDSSRYASTQSGGASSVESAPISIGGPSLLTLLDIPLVVDTYNLSGFPAGMAGYLPGWKSGSLFRSDDAGQTWASTNTFARATPFGLCTSILPAPADTRMIDTSSVLSAALYAGALSSVTELQMLNGANHFAVGVDGRWEIIAAETCALQGDGTYKLSNLLRGRFGTEWASGLHAASDTLVYLSARHLQFVLLNINQIGQAKDYRAITSGAGIDSSASTTFSYKGVNLECLSPVWLNGDRHPTTNDWTLTWLRRTRTGGEWRDKVDAALGETSEAYEVEIYSSNTYTTLRRTLTGLTAATCAYSSANQVSDFGSNQTTLYIKVYQLSATMGRGYPLTTSITR